MKKGEAGFTVLEVLAAASLLLVFVAAALGTIRAAMEAERVQTRQASVQTALRRSVTQMAQDLRFGLPPAQCMGGSGSEHPILIVFRPDGLSWTYTLNTSTGILSRGPYPLAEGLTGGGFTCLDPNLVQVRLVMPGTQTGTDRELSVKVALRAW